MHPVIERALLLVAGLLLGALLMVTSNIQAHAAPAAKSDAPGDCSHFATNGPIEIQKCIDPQTGAILYNNNVGFLAVAP